jgi:hypothetical protein
LDRLRIGEERGLIIYIMLNGVVTPPLPYPLPYFFVPKEMRLPWALHYSDIKQSLNIV